MDEDGTGNFFRSFANAMLERSLPAIREWLATRLGPGSEVGSVQLDDGTVVVRDSRVRFGPRLWIDVHEARLDARAEDLVAGLPPARLRRLRGALRVVKEGQTTFEAPLVFAGSGGASQAWVDGELQLGETQPKGTQATEATALAGSAHFTVTADGWEMRNGALSSGSTAVRLAGSGSLLDRSQRLRGAHAQIEAGQWGQMLEVLAVLRGRRLNVPLPLPSDAAIDGSVTLENGRVKGTLDARTPRTALTLSFESEGRTLRSGTLRGEAAPEEILPPQLGAWMDRTASSVLRIDATGKGALDALDATISLEAEALASPWLTTSHPATAKVDIEGGRRYRVQLEIDGAGTLSGEAGLAPYGSLDGHAHATLTPEAWGRAGFTATGAPVTLVAMLSGMRSAPEARVSLESRGDVSVQRDGSAPLTLRRPQADASFSIKDRKLHWHDANARTRVGPGSAEIRRRDEETHIRLARVDSTHALAAVGLWFEQTWIGHSDDVRFEVPTGTELWAELSVVGRSVTGQVHVESPRSRLSFVPFRYVVGSFDGTTARATLAFEDAIRLGFFRASPLLPSGSGHAEVQIDLSGRGTNARLHATARAARVPWRSRLDQREIGTLKDAAVELEVKRGSLELTSVSGYLFGGAFMAKGGIRREGDTRVVRLDHARLRGASKGVREWLVGDRAPDALRGLSVDAELSGDLRALEGEVKVRSERSHLEADLSLGPDGFGPGSGFRGRLDPADLRPWTGPVELDGDGLDIGAELGGSMRDPEITLWADGGAMRARWASVVVRSNAHDSTPCGRGTGSCSRLCARGSPGANYAPGPKAPRASEGCWHGSRWPKSDFRRSNGSRTSSKGTSSRMRRSG